MKPPAFLGKLLYFFGYPLFRLLIKNTHRTYVVVRIDETVLATKNWLGFQKKWRLPGGGVHKNEQVVAAACRELQEEVGVYVGEHDLVHLTHAPIQSSFGYSYDIFLYTCTATPSISPDEREILEAVFIDKDTLRASSLSEELQEALRLIGW